jgi:hypothetical protein
MKHPSGPNCAGFRKFQDDGVELDKESIGGAFFAIAKYKIKKDINRRKKAAMADFILDTPIFRSCQAKDSTKDPIYDAMAPLFDALYVAQHSYYDEFHKDKGYRTKTNYGLAMQHSNLQHRSYMLMGHCLRRGSGTGRTGTMRAFVGYDTNATANAKLFLSKFIPSQEQKEKHRPPAMISLVVDE